MHKWRENALLKYATPSVRILVLALVFVLMGILILLSQMGLNSFKEMVGGSHYDFTSNAFKCFGVAVALVIIAAVEQYTRSDVRQIRYMVRARLCDSKYGNPLSLRDGQIEPYLAVWSVDYGYKIRVRCASADFEKVANLETAINSCLIGNFWGYAVIAKEEHIGGNYVDYYIDDEAANAQRQNIYDSIDDLRDRYV